MTFHRAFLALLFLLACTELSQPVCGASPESVAVRYIEGLSRGFLVVRTQDGGQIADGDSSQVAHGDRVTSRMKFRFKDGSVEDETTVFSQRGSFRLLTYHVLQKGPAFKRPMETSIDATTGRVVVRYTGDDGKEKVVMEESRSAIRSFQRPAAHIIEKRSTDPAENDSVILGCHAEAENSPACDYSTRRGSVLDGHLETQSHRLRRESGNRWSSGRHSSSGRKTAPGHTRMGPYRRSSYLRGIRRSILRGGPRLADRSPESGPARTGGPLSKEIVNWTRCNVKYYLFNNKLKAVNLTKVIMLKCCRCGKRTRKFTQICQVCGHRFCKLCKGGKGA